MPARYAKASVETVAVHAMPTMTDAASETIVRRDIIWLLRKAENIHSSEYFRLGPTADQRLPQAASGKAPAVGRRRQQSQLILSRRTEWGHPRAELHSDN